MAKIISIFVETKHGTIVGKLSSVRTLPQHKQKNARILLVILFPGDTAAVTTLDSSDFWAFNDGMSET